MVTAGPNQAALAPAEQTVLTPQFQNDVSPTTAASRLDSSAPAVHLPAEDQWLLPGVRPKWATAVGQLRPLSHHLHLLVPVASVTKTGPELLRLALLNARTISNK